MSFLNLFENILRKSTWRLSGRAVYFKAGEYLVDNLTRKIDRKVSGAQTYFLIVCDRYIKTLIISTQFSLKQL